MPAPQEKRRDMDEDREWVGQVLAQLQYREFFGVLEIQMNRGMIQTVDKKEVLIPPRRVREREQKEVGRGPGPA